MGTCQNNKHESTPKRFVNIQAWRYLALASSLQLLDFLAFVSLHAHFPDVAFLNHVFFNDLFVEMRECLNLEVEEGLDRLNVGSSSLHRLANVSEHVSYARFCILELILDSLAIQV